ncbi:MAG: DNA mismatch repair endonuclease MutL [Rectinema sp.]
MGKIRILPPETSRRIAAGEVIDRPASALRELLDNAIDADAHDISVSILQGGIEEITVSDNGYGMSKEDLLLSIREYATSKIYDPDDILKAKTLGFRGEALASIAAVARLEIATRPRALSEGWRLVSSPLQEPTIDLFPCKEGTRVSIRGLFESFPARRQFLKRPQSEAFLCRTTFVEHALAHPDITFRWRSSNDTQVITPSSHKERIVRCYPELSHMPIFEASSKTESMQMRIVYADISSYRKDRKFLQVFVNRRRVPEWGLISLMEYEFGKYLPGGAHAVAFLFLEIEPSLADFNIHPAKKEVRLKNPAEVRSVVHTLLSNELTTRYRGAPKPLDAHDPIFGGMAFASEEPMFLPTFDEARPYTAGEPSGRWAQDTPFFSPVQSAKAQERGTQLPADFWQKMKQGQLSSPRYIGKGPGPFLLFEMEDTLFILDQHAAHERILYDKIKAKRGESQPLLVPYILEPQENEQYLKEASQTLEYVGYRIKKESEVWVVEAIPAIAAPKALEALVEWLSQPSPDAGPMDAIAASLSCKAAIKDGDILDQFSAERLIAEALALPEPRCPHGRPIFIAISKEKLYTMFGRIVE